MKTPAVGTVFWQRRPARGWIKHEVRAIVDDRFVFRRHSQSFGWLYEIEAIYIWEKVWLSPADAEEPHVTLDAKVAARLNRKHVGK